MADLHELDREIAGEIYTSDESWRVLRDLCLFGGRCAGTPSEAPALAYMKALLEGYGLDKVAIQPFEFLGWLRGESKLEVTAPQQRELACLGMAFTKDGSVEAELINVEWAHPDVLARLGDTIRGKIALVRTRASHEAIPGLALQETDTERYARVVRAGAVGYVNWNQVPGRSAMTRAVHYANLKGEIQGTGISHADGRFLLELTERGPVTVRMTERHRMEPLEAHNVLAELPGTDKADEIVLIGAHFDGRDINQGALNDASGAVVVMEAARAMARLQGRLRRTVRFVLYGCELYGYRGSFAHCESIAEELDRVRFMFNLDAAGRPGGSGLGISVVGWPDYVTLLRGFAADMRLPYEMDIADRFGLSSDFVPYMLQGIPTATAAYSDIHRTTGWPDDMGLLGDLASWRETVEDTIDKTAPEYVRRDAIQAARLTLRLANAEVLPGSRLSREETVEQIERYGFTERLEDLYYKKARDLIESGLDYDPSV